MSTARKCLPAARDAIGGWFYSFSTGSTTTTVLIYALKLYLVVQEVARKIPQEPRYGHDRRGSRNTGSYGNCRQQKRSAKRTDSYSRRGRAQDHHSYSFQLSV